MAAGAGKAAAPPGGAASRTAAGKVEGRILRYLEKHMATTPELGVAVSQVADMAKGGDVSRQDIRRALETLESVGSVESGQDGRGRRVWLTQREVPV